MEISSLLFARFRVVFDILEGMNPAAMAMVGSRGDSTKTPDEFSDIDTILVFEGADIVSIVELLLRKLNQIDDLQTVYLGVHFQFGHVVSAFFMSDPLRWIDIGLMDDHFARNYLVNLPMTVRHGRVQTCGIPPSPRNQMQHLARKLKKALLRNDRLQLASCAFRYLSWLQVDDRNSLQRNSFDSSDASPQYTAARLQGSETDSMLNGYLSNDVSKVVDAVLLDVATRFPELAATPSQETPPKQA